MAVLLIVQASHARWARATRHKQANAIEQDEKESITPPSPNKWIINNARHAISNGF
jgi:hypothetical protein